MEIPSQNLIGSRTTGGASLDLPRSAGQALRVDFNVGGDLIHVRYGSHGAAVLDRYRLRRWLTAPHGEWTTDEVTFVDAGGRIALMLHGLGWWWLASAEVQALRAAV